MAPGAAMASDDQPVAPEIDISDAAVHPSSTEKPVPSNLNITLAASQIINLANAGLDESVMLAYITNSAKTFDLGPDEIIYLSDIGVPNSVVAAMIQHDRLIADRWPSYSSAPEVS